jgi:hypothetical protein
MYPTVLTAARGRVRRLIDASEDSQWGRVPPFNRRIRLAPLTSINATLPPDVYPYGGRPLSASGGTKSGYLERDAEGFTRELVAPRSRDRWNDNSSRFQRSLYRGSIPIRKTNYKVLRFG